ncbi:hypothetical protein PCANC_06716 [Puccinia coronata f. sp. avenae]|uniref:C2H2-type domain-containing protein n=1 Tax=Puccinia coronata f. sp. avenae TaxID=200324 RepID=A0A2N5VU88_9BASI|nr:hypothetical protein PCANC_06716 [Puccinia coronata f. sp. avenae]
MLDLMTYDLPSQLRPNRPPSIITWLHGTNAPQSDMGESYYEALPSPSSTATFSALPTPTGTSFSPDCFYLPLEENPPIDINVNHFNVDLPLPFQSNVLHSPSHLDLHSGLGYFPPVGAVPEASYWQCGGNNHQFVNSPASYCCSLDSYMEYPTGLLPASSTSHANVYHHNSLELSSRRNSSTPPSAFDHAPSFGYMATEPGFLGPLEQQSAHPGGVPWTDLRNAPITLANINYPNNANTNKRTISHEMEAEDEQVSCKRRYSTDSDKENIDPFQADNLSSLLKRVQLVGSRLKPGPKSKFTLVQHPPPGANAKGVTPCKQDSGITKDILKCLYRTEYYPSETAEGPKIKRHFCKIEDCGRSFARKTAIESHLQTHLEDKPFICSRPDCNAAFVRQHDLRRHEQIHSKSKSYICVWSASFPLILFAAP